MTRQQALRLPTEEEIIEICGRGENQIVEFKGQGAEPKVIAKEIAGMLHTRQGGMIFYGVSDDGKVQGSDQSQQQFDQSLQNCLRDSFDPPVTVTINHKKVMGSEIFVLIVPPWNKSDVYLYRSRAFIRKGTNVFAVKSQEIKKLYGGEYID
ncbi:MAG: ATP-binding protein [Alphaproteobacteria bacterium]|nr:ATP-binding protein [Alphaproteobacteria bacterium]